jgi:hypothetical protein
LLEAASRETAGPLPQAPSSEAISVVFADRIEHFRP